jgi:hypothetical protein
MTAPSPAPLISPAEIWCVIPVYNNAATITDIANRALAQISNVIVIDDGSTDADLRELLKALNLTVIRHPMNQGKGAALLTAMRHAAAHGCKYLIALDGDGQHFPEDLPRFVPHLAPDTIVIGSREEITGEMPHSSQFGRNFSDFWIYTETGRPVRDSQSGFRAYPLSASLNLNLSPSRYGFEVEILTKALWSGMRTQSIPIQVYYPPKSDRISSFHPVRDNTRLTFLHAKLLARQFLPIPHRKAGENARRVRTPVPALLPPVIVEKATESGECLLPPLLPGEASGTGDCPRAGWGEGKFQAMPLSQHPLPASPYPRIPASPSVPFTSALTAAVSTFFPIVLYPWGFLPVLYLSLRLHLNKPLALICVLLCTPPAIANLSTKIGRALIHSDAHPNLERFIGSHIIAIPACLAAAAVAYTVARKLQTGSEA